MEFGDFEVDEASGGLLVRSTDEYSPWIKIGEDIYIRAKLGGANRHVLIKAPKHMSILCKAKKPSASPKNQPQIRHP